MVKVLLGATDNKTTIYVPIIVQHLIDSFIDLQMPIEIKVVITLKASRFIDFNTISPIVETFVETSKWDPATRKHAVLAKWADILVIAPLGANTMAKLENGLCDNLLTSIARAWNPKAKPMILCPALNGMVLDNPITNRQITTLGHTGCIIITVDRERYKREDVGAILLCDVTCIVDSIKWMTLRPKDYDSS